MHDYCKLTSSAQARVKEQTQMHLFKQTVSDLIKRWRVPMRDVEEMFIHELLSFKPDPELSLEPPQEAELTFLLTLKRAGWSTDLMIKALSNLTKPYCYDAKRMLYDVNQRRWMTRSSLDERELTIEGQINRAKDDKDVKTLREIANEAMRALVVLTEEAIDQADTSVK
jgi:hypothetical protein